MSKNLFFWIEICIKVLKFFRNRVVAIKVANKVAKRVAKKKRIEYNS